jgi:deoxyribonuclease IV
LKLGLKLWSTNNNYLAPAIDLFSQKIFDYIELFVVPQSDAYIKTWCNLEIPFVLHAPHSYAGLNFSIPNQEQSNVVILECVNNYREQLNPKYVIFHPGMIGSIIETVRQINQAKLKYPELMHCALIENKPYIGIKGERCLGFSYKDISFILQNTDLGFCFDFGHAISAAYSQQKPWQAYLEKLLTLGPEMYHISDGHVNSPLDEHLNIAKGDYDFQWIISKLLPPDLVSLETKKSSMQDLDDFKKDCLLLKRIVL